MSKCNCKNPVNLKDKQEGCTRSQDKKCCGNAKGRCCKNTKKKQFRARFRYWSEHKKNRAVTPGFGCIWGAFVLDDLL